MMDLFWFLYLGLVFPCTTGQWAYDGDNLSHLLSELKILKEAQNECTNKYSELARYKSRVLSLENTVKDLQDTVNKLQRENAELVQKIHRLADKSGQMETLNVNNYETKGPVEDYPVVHNRDEIINATNTLQERVKEAKTTQRDDRRIRKAIGRSFTLRPTPTNPEALSVGDHVIRGPDWTWKDQDANTTGIVTGASIPGWVTVMWGNGFENTYRYGIQGKYDVSSVNKGYSSCAPSVTALSGTISVGDRVIRGPDWKYTNQGGNGTGRVIGVDNQIKGTWVKVRWSDGSENFYRFGAEGKYDVIKEKTGVTTTVIPKSTVSVYTFRVGDRVVRGPDWQWGNQDSGGTGTVTAVDQTGWVTVRWDNNLKNTYRNGIQNSHDLQKAGSSTTSSAPKTHATSTPPSTGTGLANVMYIGARVQRGKDWKWGNQDGNGSGEVNQLPPNVPPGWVRVLWDNGNQNFYRIGAENAYDIMFVPGSYNPPFG